MMQLVLRHSFNGFVIKLKNYSRCFMICNKWNNVINNNIHTLQFEAIGFVIKFGRHTVLIFNTGWAMKPMLCSQVYLFIL